MKYPALSDIWRLEHALAPTLHESARSQVLARFSQIFPLSLFPDEIIIEELRIIHFKRNGPWANEVISIMACDIASVNASSGPLFGHIHVKSLTGGPEIMVDNLARNAVFKLRSLVEGLALSTREGLKIDRSNSQLERESLYRAGSVPKSH